jgi:hypothetical protein
MGEEIHSDAQDSDVFQSWMFLDRGFTKRVLQTEAIDFHMTIQQWRGKELHLLASETSALLVFICGKLENR